MKYGLLIWLAYLMLNGYSFAQSSNHLIGHGSYSQETIPMSGNWHVGLGVTSGNLVNKEALTCSRILSQSDDFEKGKRVPLKGFQFGISQYELLFTSLNVGYLSDKHFGVDLSYRHPLLARYNPKDYAFFVGLVYQIKKSRYFIKSGVEILSIYGEYGWEGVYIPYLGSKYLLPFSKRFGLQIDGGLYILFGEDVPVFPGFGVGVLFGLFGN